MPSRKPFFTGLESLRGLAALVVVFYHLPPWYPSFFDARFVRNGYLMVDFFFVLSGFVMALNYGRRVRDGRDFGRFVRVRFARLYPVHLVFLLAFLGVEVLKWVAVSRGLGGGGNTVPFRENGWGAFVQHVFLTQGFGLGGAISSFNGPSRSISTEFYTYLVFGLALWGLGARRLVPFSCGVLAFGATAYLTLMPTPFEHILRCLIGFFAGCLAHAWYARGVRWPGWVASVALLAFVAFLALAEVAHPALVLVPLSAVLVVAETAPTRARSWLAWRPFAWLGTISYSLYMSHALVLWFVNQLLRFGLRLPERASPAGVFPEMALETALWVYPLTVLLCVLVGWATYVGVEAPSHRWAKRLKG